MEKASNVERISPDNLRRLIEQRDEGDYALIDVRQPSEYRQEHLPGAQLIPVSEIEKHLHQLNPQIDHIFYCKMGARSSAAALLAQESGLFKGTILNLEGGIDAWGTGSVSDLPRVNVFEGISTVKELLLKALDLEKAAHLMYSKVRQSTDRDAMCDLMDTLIEVEVAHAKVVYSHLVRLAEQGDAPPNTPLKPFEELYDSLEGRVLEGGLTIEELEPWLRSAASGDCLEVADLALEVEMNAWDLYRTLAHAADQEGGQGGLGSDALGSDAKRIFLDLASQEKHHARMLMEKIAIFEG